MTTKVRSTKHPKLKRENRIVVGSSIATEDIQLQDVCKVEMGGSMVERFQKLGLKESLDRSYHYPIACEELSFILRNAYSKFPKNLQSLLFQDSLTAFRLLPQMQTQAAISAANGLLHSIEAALPKQKKALATSEFKQAMVAHRRRRKLQPVLEGRSQLPQDVLVHIFGFLDLKSIVTASLVCRSWSVAASDNHLWQSIHINFFGKSIDNPNIIRLTYGVERISFTQESTTAASVDWKDAFRRAYRGISKKVTSHRGYCKDCDSIVWLSNTKCSNKSFGEISDEHQILPVSIEQIVDYVTHGDIPSSDSDSDSDDSVDGSFFKLWAYPRRITEPDA